MTDSGREPVFFGTIRLQAGARRLSDRRAGECRGDRSVYGIVRERTAWRI